LRRHKQGHPRPQHRAPPPGTAIALGGQEATMPAAITAASADVPPASCAAQMPLVSRCLAGDPAAWRALHQTYYPIVAAFLGKLGVKSTDRDDACQEVFVQMLRYLPTFRGQAQLKTWVYRLCVTEARHVRHRSAVGAALRGLLRTELGARGPESGSVLTDEVARQKVDAALATLKEHERLVFVLYDMEGLSGEEVAQIAGCPVATVWRRLHYARRTFTAAVQQERKPTFPRC
jgi:RNA polymerase sigma-70 factor (ECF subfamily)